MILLNLIVGCFLFITLFLLSFGTYWFLQRHRERSTRVQHKSTALSLSNCFASGVFLSTCFLGLLPHIREHEMGLQKYQENQSASSHYHHIVNSDFMVLVGFLVMLVIEECIHLCHSGNTLEHDGRSLNNANERMDQKCVVSSSEVSQRDASPVTVEEGVQLLLSDGSSDETARAPTIEFRRSVEEKNAHDGHAHHIVPSDLSFTTIALLLGLSTHSIFEGIALALQVDTAAFFHVLFAIMLHELLCSFAFGVSLTHQETPRRTAFLSTLILSASIPFGMTASIVVSSLSTYNALLFRFLLESLAAGVFIYVACIEMLSHELMAQTGSHPSCLRTFAVILGALAFLLITSLFEHADVSAYSHEPKTVAHAGN